MASYVRYQQVNRLRDKSSLFFLCSFILVVVYTSVIGFVIVHMLKITKGVEENNNDLLEKNKKLEQKLEHLIFRLGKLEENMEIKNSSALAYVNIIPRKQLKVDRDTKGNRNDELNKEIGDKHHIKVESQNGGR